MKWLIVPVLSLSTIVASVLLPSSHATYPLGHAKDCRTGYVKKTERHEVKKHSVRYIACVWVAPSTTTTSIPITSTTIQIVPTPTTVATISSSTTTTSTSTSTTTTTIPLNPALVIAQGVVTSNSAQIDNYAYASVSIPVTVENLSTITTGTISLTNTGLTNASCTSLVDNVALKESTSTCSFEIEDDASSIIAFVPAVSFSGDAHFAALATDGPTITIPEAPAPFVNDIQTEIVCAESGGWCSEYNSAPETTGADADVYGGEEVYDVSPQVGTVTFTSADHLLICTATVYSAADLPSNNARCTGNGGPFEGPITVAYSGGSVEVGDTEEDVYEPSTATGGSN